MPVCYRYAKSDLRRLEPMELRSIQYFMQVADEGSITRTANKIGIAQPALTRHIKQLEAELGTELLMRLPRGVRLTTSGRDFLDHARAITLEVTPDEAEKLSISQNEGSLSLALRSSGDEKKVDTSALTPLTDMGKRAYHGFTGGLYPDGKNERPPVSCASWRMTNSASRNPFVCVSTPRSAIV